jgi:hypothetical protein
MAGFFGLWEDFPNLAAAENAKSITDLMRETLPNGKQAAELAEEKRVELENQRATDFRSFAASQPVAIERGNRNACADQAQFSAISEQLATNAAADWQGRVTPYAQAVRPYGSKANQTRIPKPSSAGAIRAGSGVALRQPVQNFRTNQGRTLPPATTYQAPSVEPTLFPEKAAANQRKFVQAQAGQRGTAIGDRALSFSANGTPLYGDTILDRSAQENLAANVAATAPPVTSAPRAIATGPKLPGKALVRGANGQIHPKGDTVTAGLALAFAGAAISLIMFPIQYLIQFFSFMLQVQTATSNIRNIATSTTTFISNIGYLMGMGPDTLQPVEKTIDGILNNVFGKDKVEYVKLQFAKLSTAVNAAVNIVDAFRDGNDALAGAVTQNARNTSRIGNFLRGAGIFSNKFDWMDEKISAHRGQGKLAKLNQGLAVTGTVASSLREVTAEIKEAADEAEELQKEYDERAKAEKKDNTKETAPLYSDGPVTVPTIREGRA